MRVRTCKHEAKPLRSEAKRRQRAYEQGGQPLSTLPFPPTLTSHLPLSLEERSLPCNHQCNHPCSQSPHMDLSDLGALTPVRSKVTDHHASNSKSSKPSRVYKHIYIHIPSIHIYTYKHKSKRHRQLGLKIPGTAGATHPVPTSVPANTEVQSLYTVMMATCSIHHSQHKLQDLGRTRIRARH